MHVGGPEGTAGRTKEWAMGQWRAERFTKNLRQEESSELFPRESEGVAQELSTHHGHSQTLFQAFHRPTDSTFCWASEYPQSILSLIYVESQRILKESRVHHLLSLRVSWEYPESILCLVSEYLQSILNPLLLSLRLSLGYPKFTR